MTVPVLLDCDPGHDDAMAILLAAASPVIDLLGITTVAGNQTLPKTTLNARRICTAAGITSVPIAVGRARPLHGPVAVARVIEPALVPVVTANAAVELAGTHTRGATVVDLNQVTGRPPNARVAIGLDVGRFWELIVTAVAALG
jgi:inosine-uridine nucleoside N-ribohydrolase